MTATFPHLHIDWFDRSTALITLSNGDTFPAISEGGWHTVDGPDDARSFDQFEDLLGWLQEEL